MPPWYLESYKIWVIFSHVEKNCQKNSEKIYRSSPPWANFFSFGGPKGKKLPLGDQEKKSSSRGLKKGSFYFLWSPKGSFFHLVPQRKFFTLWYPKGKKIAQGVEDRGKFFLFFWQFFSQCEKITQFLEFCKYQGVKS